MEINSPEIVSGNHVTDFSGNPNEINSTNKVITLFPEVIFKTPQKIHCK